MTDVPGNGGCGQLAITKGVRSRAESGILHAYDVQVGPSAVEPAQDVAVEGLIAHQLEHALLPGLSRGRAGAHAGRPAGPGTPRSCTASGPPPPHTGAGSPRKGPGPS